MWHVTHDMGYRTQKCDNVTFSPNFSSLPITVCDLWYYEDLKEKAHGLNDWMNQSINQSINYEAVCRTAPATLGLLISLEEFNFSIVFAWVRFWTGVLERGEVLVGNFGGGGEGAGEGAGEREGIKECPTLGYMRKFFSCWKTPWAFVMWLWTSSWAIIMWIFTEWPLRPIQSTSRNVRLLSVCVCVCVSLSLCLCHCWKLTSRCPRDFWTKGVSLILACHHTIFSFFRFQWFWHLDFFLLLNQPIGYQPTVNQFTDMWHIYIFVSYTIHQ